MTAGERLRKRVEATFATADADIMWLETLELAVAQLDLVERLAENVRTEPLTVTGSTGQIRSNPLLAELRAQRLVAARLLSTLGLAETETSTDRQQRNAAARWHR